MNGFDDLLALVLARPQRITHLVLCATSGGLPMAALGAGDWRESFQAVHPQLPDWFATDRTDLTGQLPALKQPVLKQPVLLLWGEADPISPMAVGEQLTALLPRGRLQVIPGAVHDLALERAATAAPLIGAPAVPPS